MFKQPHVFNQGFLKVSSLHTIYYEECGNPEGKPVVVLHGGPGAGIIPETQRLHDPAVYRIIAFDQRGCGHSTPHGELRENTTWDLVEDIEKLRQHLNIQRWQVAGGSWGSTLALAYAQTWPQYVSEMILRGIFTLRDEEVRWFYQEGAHWVFPEEFERYQAPIPPEERGDMINAYYKRLTGENETEKNRCAQAWTTWEASTLSLYPDPARVAAWQDDAFALAFARIECHYFVNKGFFKPHDQLLRNAAKLGGIPARVIQGRYDMCTPYKTAWELACAWPDAQLITVNDAGHATTEPGIVAAFIEASQAFAR